jgi:hypothetical protein
MENVGVKNELSSRPERSVVEGPAVSLVRHPMQRKGTAVPFVIPRSWLACGKLREK